MLLRHTRSVFALVLVLAQAVGVAPAVHAAIVSVDLGPSDQTAGLANSQRGPNTDGENDAVTTGPADDLRGARINRAGSDDDVPDLYTYFVVSAGAVKSSPRLRITGTFYDDPDFSGTPARVSLHYTNAASTGVSDLANTFAGHPDSLSLNGSGRWVRFTWTITDAGFRTFMQGTSDFRFDLGPRRVAIDRVEVETIPAPSSPTEHLVAAHYYPWYTTGRWSYTECYAGALRLELRPPQPPALGRYDSSSSAVVDQHLRWCAEYGVNVLILEFIQPGSREDQVCLDVILPHPRSGDVRFSVLYDWAIRFGNFDVTQARIDTARADVRHLAREYFPHPSYLKVAGEAPVLMIYVTRALSGDVDGLIAALRETCASEGFGLFLVGDEFFFPSSPQASKIRRWDAIFGYDAYAGRGGYWGENGTLDLFRQRTSAYRQVAEDNGVKFFPSCAPGFNDRAIRRTCADNPALSRRVTRNDEATSLFRELFSETALASVDPELPLVCVTSFNEWHEDTQIEPTVGRAASTAEDSSASGSQYTEGIAHDDYGLAFLEVIRDATLAATGRVLGDDGPLPGATVEVLDGESVVLTRTSFSTGFYTVPRLLLRAGRSYRLRASLGELLPITSEPFRVLSDRAVTDFDLSLSVGPLVSRGDCNADGEQDISDPVALLSFLFTGGATPPCLEACDSTAEGVSDISDAIYLLGHIFLGGPPPAAPAFPACEPVPDAVGCPAGNCQR